MYGVRLLEKCLRDVGDIARSVFVRFNPDANAQQKFVGQESARAVPLPVILSVISVFIFYLCEAVSGTTPKTPVTAGRSAEASKYRQGSCESSWYESKQEHAGRYIPTRSYS